MTPETAPRLETWVTVTQAAEILGLSRQTVNHMVHDGVFESLHLFGSPTRPQHVLDRYEVEELATSRESA